MQARGKHTFGIFVDEVDDSNEEDSEELEDKVYVDTIRLFKLCFIGPMLSCAQLKSSYHACLLCEVIVDNLTQKELLYTVLIQQASDVQRITIAPKIAEWCAIYTYKKSSYYPSRSETSKCHCELIDCNTIEILLNSLMCVLVL